MRDNNLNIILHNMNCNANDWRLDQFRAIHRSGLKIWIGNGFLGYHIEKPKYQELGWIEKYKLYRQLKLLTDNKNSKT